MSYDKRMDWAEGLSVPLLADNPNAEYLYFVGCAGAFDDRNKKTVAAFTRIPQQGRVSFAVLGPEEPATARPPGGWATNICFRPWPRLRSR